MSRPSIYEAAGGEQAFQALARAHHELCLADPVLNHPFSHSDQNPDHVARLGSYWAEVFGGPTVFSESMNDQTAVLTMHAGMGADDDLGDRFLGCFLQAIDDAGLPDDSALRSALRAYMQWAVADVHAYNPPGSTVEPGLAVPRWSWDGLQAA